MVAGGHMTKAPATLTYASAVSRESVRIALTLAALNDLEVKTADIENAYLTAPMSEKIWTKLGPEFGADNGMKAILVQALYGLKSVGASFRNHLATCMRQLGYTSCMADPDVWLRAEPRPDDRFKYYSYLLLYADDILAINHDSTSVIKEIDRFFKMKSGTIGDPDIYWGLSCGMSTYCRKQYEM
jgi:Reverse transcriptase (RNA-dependent DNA polymerase)